MGLLNKLFGRSELIEVSNKWGVGDGTALFVEERPDLERIFSNPGPKPPQHITDRNRKYWEELGQQGVLNALAIAYLSHPDPQVRASTIPLTKDVNGQVIDQVLVDLLADSSDNVRSAAAEALWHRALPT
jgi:hypothetical protein